MRPIAVSILTVLLVAACSAAPAPASQSPSGRVPTLSPSSTPLASASPTTPPAPTPSAVPTPIAVGPAPAGAWSAIRWVAGDRLPLGPTEVIVSGWSGGYVAIEQTSGSNDNGDELPVVIRASASSDGLHWSPPTPLQTGFKGNIAISTIVEGPSGLLALGYPYGDTCGGPPVLTAMWGSPDGKTWDRIPMPKAFTAGSVNTIQGGAAGFIALGARADGTTQAIWTSQDARTWAARPLPKVSSGTLALDAATGFDDGFLLLGSVLGDEGCGGSAHIHAVAWFSPDGSTWTRASLAGALTDPNATLAVQRLLGRLLVTQLLPGGEAPKLRAWTSPDGRTWTSAGDLPSETIWGSVSDGRHAVMATLPASALGAPILSGLDETGASVTISQTGEGPVTTVDGPPWLYAVGPTGVLAVSSKGDSSWLGLPT